MRNLKERLQDTADYLDKIGESDKSEAIAEAANEISHLRQCNANLGDELLRIKNICVEALQ